MKKIYKITLGIFIGIFLIISLVALNGYFNYKENLGITGENIGDYNIGDRALNSVTPEEIKDYSGYKDIEGMSNPRIKIRNSTGYEVIALDHNGSIVALGNLTVSDTTLKSGGYGFFAYLGESANRIIKGWFTDLDVKNNINSSNLTTFNVIVNGTNIDTTYLNTNDFNVTNITYRTNYNLTWVGNFNATSNVTLGTNRLFVNDATGNVGIGTTSPTSELEVNGNIEIQSNGILMAVPATPNSIELYDGATGDMILSNYYGSSSLGAIRFKTNNGNEKMTIRGDGNVGIGTTAPNYTLDVFGEMDASRITVNGTNVLTVAQFNVTNTTYRTLDNNSFANFNLNTTGAMNASVFCSGATCYTTSQLLNTTNLTYLMIDRFNVTNTSYLTDYGDIATGNYTFDTNTFFIDSTNNKIGIGTTSPTSELEVNGNIEIQSNGILMAVPATPNSIELYDGATGDMILSNYYGSSSLGAIRFKTNNGNEKMTIRGDGNVGIGTTTPQNLLNVFGDANATGTIYSNNLNLTRAYVWVTNGTFLQGNANFNNTNFIVPALNNTYDLGNSTNIFRNIWVNTLNIITKITGSQIADNTITPTHLSSSVNDTYRGLTNYTFGTSNFTGNVNMSIIFLRDTGAACPLTINGTICKNATGTFIVG